MSENKYGLLLRDARWSREMSQQKLADLIGVTDAYIAMIENGKRFPSLAIQQKISKILNTETICPVCNGRPEAVKVLIEACDKLICTSKIRDNKTGIFKIPCGECPPCKAKKLIAKLKGAD